MKDHLTVLPSASRFLSTGSSWTEIPMTGSSSRQGWLTALVPVQDIDDYWFNQSITSRYTHTSGAAGHISSHTLTLVHVILCMDTFWPIYCKIIKSNMEPTSFVSKAFSCWIYFWSEKSFFFKCRLFGFWGKTMNSCEQYSWLL